MVRVSGDQAMVAQVLGVLALGVQALVAQVMEAKVVMVVWAVQVV